MTTTIHTPSASCPTPSLAQFPPLDAGYRPGVDHLRTYIAREGHANVLQKYVTDDGFKLGIWVNSRRRDHKAGRLTPARITELDALGMAWDSLDAGYRTGLDHLRVYVAGEGHATVPKRHVADDGFKLGIWVDSRRHDHKVGRLSTARTDELNALGMVWASTLDATYRTGVDHLRDYIALSGDATVPQRYVADDGFKLGAWTNRRRHDRKVGRLSTTRIAELDALGMVWDSRIECQRYLPPNRMYALDILSMP